MNQAEAVNLLAYINRATGQPVQDGAGMVWHDLLGHLSFPEAQAATKAALQDTTRSSRWIAPADVLAAHKSIRRAAHPTPPGSAPAPILEPPSGVVIPFRKVPAAVEAIEAAGLMPEPWRDVACPYCGVPAHEPCVNTATERPTKPHPSRVDATTTERPTA